MKSVCLVKPGEFRRLSWHFGFDLGWFEASERGELDKPQHIVAVSAGALIAAAVLGWSKEIFSKRRELIENLKTSQIYRLPRSTLGLLSLTAATSLFPLLKLKNQTEAEGSEVSFTKESALHISEVLVALSLEALLIKRFLKRKSIFSNEPLRKLLMKELDEKNIFNPGIRLDIMTTDMKSGEPVIFTNYLPQDLNKQRFVSALMASTSLAGHFPNEIIDGRILGDGVFGATMPLEQAVKAGCDVVVVCLYTATKEVARDAPISWVHDIVRSSHITQSDVADFRIRDFKRRKEQEAEGQKLPELYVVQSKYPVEEVNFRKFSHEAMSDGIELGYQTFQDHLPTLRRLLA